MAPPRGTTETHPLEHQPSSSVSNDGVSSAISQQEPGTNMRTAATTPSAPSSMIDIIVSTEPSVRDTALQDYWKPLSIAELLEQVKALEAFRRGRQNNAANGGTGIEDSIANSNGLYETVRACFFLYAIHRFAWGEKMQQQQQQQSSETRTIIAETGEIPYDGYRHLQNREFEAALTCFQDAFFSSSTPNLAVASALAQTYHALGFDTLARQVRRSVQQFPGNSWMYDVMSVPTNGCGAKYYKVQLAPHQILHEVTPVRMDLSHCGWSDIFFLAMDDPQRAVVLNTSINLAVRGRHAKPVPPIESWLRVINEPVLVLESVDLEASVELRYVDQVFDFGKDYLGLLRAGVIAAGLVPLGLEQATTNPQQKRVPLSDWLDVLVGPGRGLHLTTRVNDIPKGSRLAVSTNLLASIIAIGMRATGQTSDGSTTGILSEAERRTVAARAILGEWLGGSGGGWQDSGGVWPGMKLIHGVSAQPGHAEYGISRGQLLPQHVPLGDVLYGNYDYRKSGSNNNGSKDKSHVNGDNSHDAAIIQTRMNELAQTMQRHLVLVHGGMAQNVGPILELVTEKYLLREPKEWAARQDCLAILRDILDALHKQDIARVAALTTRNFEEPLQTIIPNASNLYTETLIQRTRDAFGSDFMGFWMLGGASGGGMGFMFTAQSKPRALQELTDIMLETKQEMQQALPFAMDPVVYDFEINQDGTKSQWWDVENEGPVPAIGDMKKLMENGGHDSSDKTNGHATSNGQVNTTHPLDQLLEELQFDTTDHVNVQRDYRAGKIGLEQNRLPLETQLEDIRPEHDLIYASTTGNSRITAEVFDRGVQEIEKGTVAVVSLAAGVGSRWTNGAGCVKALNPFCKLQGHHRSFLEVHLAKSRRVSETYAKETGFMVPHVITTSHMTHSAVETYLKRVQNHGYQGPLYVSQGKSMGLRLIPTKADLKFSWQHQSKLDDQAQKVRASGQKAILGWVDQMEEAADYRDNIPLQCLHPVGHWYEIPNLILNGTLAQMLGDRPQLKYLMLHNIDTVGADVDPGLLGLFASDDSSTLSFEVIPRRVEDVGGGLARVNGKTRLVEGLALPRQDDEFKFTYYNSMTTWIDIDKLLKVFGLSRDDVLAAGGDEAVSTEAAAKVAKAIHAFSARLPTYVALKEVKKRLGDGHEDIFPTAQFEKLWSDMSSLDDVDCQFVVVPRYRGSQLKDVAQLDGWLRDGSAAYLEQLCAFDG